MASPTRDSTSFMTSFESIYNAICQRIRLSGKLDQIMEKFQNLRTDLERIKYVIQMKEVQTIDLTENYGQKNAEEAADFESTYDHVIPDTTQATKALEVITRSLQKTPSVDIHNLAIRYMKRSWVFFLLGKFDCAFLDATRALELNIPHELVWNAHEILGHCFANQQRHKQAQSHFQNALAGLRKSDATNEVKAIAAGRITAVLKTMKAGKGKKIKGTEASSPLPAVPQVSYGQHKILECASAAIDISVTKGKGRLAVAVKDIKPGDVIMVDRPYATVMNPEHYNTHCFHCFSILQAPVPCPSCSEVMYCSEKCQNSSWSSVHDLECHILRYLQDPVLGKMGLLVFRILKRAGWEMLKNSREKIQAILLQEKTLETPERSEHLFEDYEQQPWQWSGLYCPDDYITVFQQVTNSSKRTFGDLLKRSVGGIYIAHCLNFVNFFGSQESEDSFCYLSSLALHHLQSCSCNAYEISEHEQPTEMSLHSTDEVELGGAVYSSFSLTNHSCIANVLRYNVGTLGVMRATRFIPKGTEILDNYGYYFHVIPKAMRQEVLHNQYKFQCECEACLNDWPTLQHQQVDSFSLYCPASKCHQIVSCVGGYQSQCPKCGNTQQFKKLMNDLKQQMKKNVSAKEKIKNGDIKGALPLLLEHQLFLDKHSLPQRSHCIDNQVKIRLCFNLLGNTYKKLLL